MSQRGRMLYPLDRDRVDAGDAWASYAARMFEEEQIEWREAAADTSAHIEQREREWTLSDELVRLPSRQASIIALLFGLCGEREHSLSEVGAIFGVTRERIRQIENKALRTLRGRLRSNEPPGFDRDAFVAHQQRLISEHQERAKQERDQEQERLLRVVPTPQDARARPRHPSWHSKALQMLARIHAKHQPDTIIDICDLIPTPSNLPGQYVMQHECMIRFTFDDASTLDVPPGLYLVPAGAVVGRRLPDGITLLGPV
jgi:hypothetical protein